METELQAARYLLYVAAAKVTANAPDKTRFAAMAKRLATDTGSSVVDRALQLHGGYGYLMDYPIERFWRDLRVHSILEGTNQVMRMIVSRDLHPPVTDDVLISVEGGVGRLRLNRPKAIHALTTHMCRGDERGACSNGATTRRSRRCVIDHAEGRGFCAGGDVVMLCAERQRGRRPRRAPSSSPNIGSTICCSPTPSRPSRSWTGSRWAAASAFRCPCRYRVATENTRFAMPETDDRPVPRRRRRLVSVAAARPGRRSSWR